MLEKSSLDNLEESCFDSSNSVEMDGVYLFGSQVSLEDWEENTSVNMLDNIPKEDMIYLPDDVNHLYEINQNYSINVGNIIFLAFGYSFKPDFNRTPYIIRDIAIMPKRGYSTRDYYEVLASPYSKRANIVSLSLIYDYSNEKKKFFSNQCVRHSKDVDYKEARSKIGQIKNSVLSDVNKSEIGQIGFLDDYSVCDYYNIGNKKDKSELVLGKI